MRTLKIENPRVREEKEGRKGLQTVTLLQTYKKKAFESRDAEVMRESDRQVALQGTKWCKWAQ